MWPKQWYTCFASTKPLIETPVPPKKERGLWGPKWKWYLLNIYCVPGDKYHISGQKAKAFFVQGSQELMSTC
jgi:hypothetical protein